MSQILAPLSLAQILDWTIVGILAHFLTQILSVYFLFVLFFFSLIVPLLCQSSLIYLFHKEHFKVQWLELQTALHILFWYF